MRLGYDRETWVEIGAAFAARWCGIVDTRLNHAVAVAQTGTFTAAAKKVGVTQSAITRSIADLEREVGYSIFIRTARGAILTEQGRDFTERAHKLIEETKELLRKPHGGDEGQYTGVLHVGVCPASIEFFLLDAIEEFLRRYPAVKIDLSGSTFERTVQQLRNGAIDLAVGYEAAFHDWPDLRRQVLPIQTGGLMFVRKGHPLAGVANPTAEQMTRYDFVSPSDSRPYGSMLRGLFDGQEVDWRKRMHVVDFFPMVKRIVARSDAIGMVMESFVQRSRSFRQEFATFTSSALTLDRTPLCCAYRTRWEIVPPARAFMAILRTCRLA